MKIENLVLTIEQMQHLKELGLEVKDTALCWVGKLKYEFSVNPHTVFSVEVNKGKQWQYNGIVTEHIPTLTFQEILECLPKKIEINSREYYLFINYQDGEVSYAISDDEMFYTIMFEDIWPNTLQGAYNMLCWVLENGYLNASNSMPLNKE